MTAEAEISITLFFIQAFKEGQNPEVAPEFIFHKV